MWKAKEDFLWYKKREVIPSEEIEKYPNWKAHCEEELIQGVILPKPVVEEVKVIEPVVEVKVEEIPLDLNKDKVVDSKDAKIASKVMNKVKKDKKKGFSLFRKRK